MSTQVVHSANHAQELLTTEEKGQYSLWQILGIWLAGGAPIWILAWLVYPALRQGLGAIEGALLWLKLDILGLVWQFVLVLILTRRELGGLRWSRVREALWLRPPRDPRSGRVGGRVWWWVLLFIVLFALEEFLPGLSGPPARDLAGFLESGGGREFFRGAWGWFAVFVAHAIFNTVLGEELLFRGLLLPRMNRVFGRGDWAGNGVLFAAYHVHVPWVMPETLVGDTLLLAYPTKRYRSAWLGIVVHSGQSVVLGAIVLTLVL